MICWIGSVDPVDDLYLTNQIYSALLNDLEFKEITEVQNAHLQILLKMTKRDLVVASTRHHVARFLKYYPRRQCAPSLIKSRFFPYTTSLLTVLTFLLLKFLICVHAGNLRVPPRVLAQRRGGNKAKVNHSKIRKLTI